MTRRDPGPLLHPEHEHNRGSAPWPEHGGIIFNGITLHHGLPDGPELVVPPPPPAAGGIAAMYVIGQSSPVESVIERVVRDRARQMLEGR